MITDDAFAVNMANMVTDSIKEMAKNGTSELELLTAVVEILVQKKALMIMKTKHYNKK